MVGFHAGVPALRGAFVAVDVFFVLSGFFLATTLVRRLATDEPIRPAELAARRLWRLLPLLAVVLLGTLATTLLYAPIDRAMVAERLIPSSVFASNVALAAEGVNYFHAGENPLLHTWTLGVELQLALLLPLLVMGFAALGERRATARGETGADRRWTIVRAAVLGLAITGAISFVMAVVINDIAPMWAYFGPHTRLWSFCAGALMAFLTGGGQNAVGPSPQRVVGVQLMGLALLVAPALLYDGTLAYPGAIALAPVAGTMFLLASGGTGGDTWPGRVLAARPLVALGQVSYAWYLWHWPMMVLGGVLAPGIGPMDKLAWGVVGLGAAVLTHRLLARVEVNTLVRRVSADRPLLAAVGTCALLALVGLGAARANTRFVDDSVHRRFAEARDDDMHHSCWGRSLRAEMAVRAGCAFGSPTASRRIALWGDSHASHWLGGLDAAGKGAGWRVDAHVMGACPVADLRGLVDGAAARLYEKCAAFQQSVMRRLAAERPDAIILSNSDHYLRRSGGLMSVPGIAETDWVEGLRRTYTALDELGIRVIVLRDVPLVPFDVPSCLSRRAARLPLAIDCSFAPDRAFMARAQRAQDRAARGLPVRFVDLNDLVCEARAARCATERDGLILYTDDDHITRSFSRALAPALAERIVSAIASAPHP